MLAIGSPWLVVEFNGSVTDPDWRLEPAMLGPWRLRDFRREHQEGRVVEDSIVELRADGPAR